MEKLKDSIIIYPHRNNAPTITVEKINEIINWINHAGCNQTIKDNQRIIPIQTPNPQSNERFDLLLWRTKVNLLRALKCTEKGISKSWIQIALNDIENQANGETPVEDNTVGQVDIVEFIRTIREHSIRGNTIDVQYGLDKLIQMINKPVETTKEQPEYSFELKNINATDCPMRITNLNTKEIREYAFEGLPWKMMNEFDSEIIHYIFTHFKSDTKIG